MAQTLSLTGTLRLTPTDTAPPAAVPVAFSTTFTQKSEQDLTFTGVVTNREVDRGSIVAPRFVYIEVSSGTVEFSFASNGANPFQLSVDEVPAPADKAILMLYTHNPDSFQLYMTTTGPVACRVWFFA